MIEIKDAALSHTVQGRALDVLLTRAQKQGKGAEYVIHFAGVNITMTGRLERGMG